MVKETLPTVQVVFHVTPSEATNAPAKYDRVFEFLRMDAGPTPTAHFRLSEDGCKGKNFGWKWTHEALAGADSHSKRATEEAAERKSYSAVCEHISALVKPNLCLAIPEGQGVSGGNLFDEPLHSMRSRPFAHGEQVYLRATIRGRSDLVVVKQVPRGPILRHQVLMAIEVKTQAAMNLSSTGCEREAVLQLIGLNIANTAHTPPVVLTNLVGTHRVYFLEYQGTADDPAGYVVKRTTCHCLCCAIHLASDIASRRCISADFARAPTPDVSIDNDMVFDAQAAVESGDET
jgi:hypothetical protein